MARITRFRSDRERQSDAASDGSAGPSNALSGNRFDDEEPLSLAL